MNGRRAGENGASRGDNLPAVLTLDVRGERGYLVVTVGDDDVVRAWLTTDKHPRTGEDAEGLFIPLDIDRGEAGATGRSHADAIAERLGSTERGSRGEAWPEREEPVGRSRLGCLLVAVAALFVLSVLYAVGSWIAS